MLEGVGGQVHPVSAAEHGCPVERGALGVQPGQRGDQRRRLRAVLAGGGHQQGRLVEAVPGHGGGHPVRADLQEGVHALPGQPAHPVLEAHGRADVPRPVLGRTDLVGDRPPGEVGHQGQLGRVERQALRDPGELGEHRLHQR